MRRAGRRKTQFLLVLLLGGMPASAAIPSVAFAQVASRDTVDAEASASAGELSSNGSAAEYRPGGVAVRWEPESPTDGTALAVTVQTPAGGGATRVKAELDGRPVRMGRVGGDWFGLVALPTDQAGPMELVVSHSRNGEPEVTTRWTVQVRPRTYSETQLSVAPRFTSPPAEVMERIARERELVRSTLGEVTAEWLIDGNFVRPRNTRITSPFGQKRVFNGELQSRHWGVDLAGDVGTPVRVAGRGRIAIARNLYYAGNAIYVDHGMGVFSGYYHLSQMDVSEGDFVERGQVIGRVGATGRVTGPHLHWSFFAGGERLDASSVLDLRVPEADNAEPEAAEIGASSQRRRSEPDAVSERGAQP
jgi:murein DD-endopeptidase MepM/ murein hydrolase activator NlpD